MRTQPVATCLHCGFAVFADWPNCPRCLALLGDEDLKDLPPTTSHEAAVRALEAGQSAFLTYTTECCGGLARAAQGGFEVAGLMGVVFVAPASWTAWMLGFAATPVLWANTAYAATCGLVWFIVSWALKRDGSPLARGVCVDLKRRELVELQRKRGEPGGVRTARVPLAKCSLWLDVQQQSDEVQGCQRLLMGHAQWPAAWGRQTPHVLHERWMDASATDADSEQDLTAEGARLAHALGIAFRPSDSTA